MSRQDRTIAIMTITVALFIFGLFLLTVGM